MGLEIIAFRFYSKKLGMAMVKNIVKFLHHSNEALGINLSDDVSMKGYHKIDNIPVWIQNQFKNDGDEALISIFHTKNNKWIAKLTCFDCFDFSLGAHLYTVLQIPIESDTNSMIKLFSEACVILEPFSAWAEPPQLREPIGKQIIYPDEKKTVPFGLPLILTPRKDSYAIHELPQYINWLNYWSAEMLQNIDYDHCVHQHLFHRVEQLENGSVFQITEQPTDPEIPEHLEKLLAVYAAFPKVGGRHLIKDMNFH